MRGIGGYDSRTILDGGLSVVRVVVVIEGVRLSFSMVQGMHETVDRKAQGGVVGGI
jgi:hypothetical protein